MEKVSSANVTKSAGNCGFGHIYWRKPQWKASFLVQRTFRISLVNVNICAGNCELVHIYLKKSLIESLILWEVIFSTCRQHELAFQHKDIK